MTGCRAVGIAGGPEKCAYVRDELGFDACVDHRQFTDVRAMSAAIGAAAPNGVDAVFENVGGIGLDATLACMNPFGRIALCGLIAGYEGGDVAIRNTRILLTMRLRIEGFIVSEHLEFWPAALAELGKGVATGAIKYRETVAEGLAAAPEAFIGMLRGKNFGKQLVKLV
jgi:NADPH-dependent curcumin reductase CurA